MNFRKIITAALLITAVTGCKKEEDTTTTPSLDGYLSIIGVPEYVKGGQTVTLTPKGLSHPDGKEITYTWRVSPSHPEACTTKVFPFTFSDTLRTYSISCTASAEGYASSSATKHAIVVKGGVGEGCSIQGIDDILDAHHFSTSDTTTYYYKQIGTQTWMLNNGAEKLLSDKQAGRPYSDASVMSTVFGRFYSYQEAVTLCESLSTPELEWKLPTLEDWRTLESYIKGQPDLGKSVAAALMGNATFNSTEMWEYWPAVGDITNSTGFSAIPVGYTNLGAPFFDGLGDYAVFWTADKAEKENEAYAVYLICNQPELYIGTPDQKSFGASVRCIMK